MSELFKKLSDVDTNESISKPQIVAEIKDCAETSGYTVIEQNDQKPWGAYLKFDNDEADSFVADLFPGLSPTEARLGNVQAELSPKILIVSPDQRLSWQYHNRRAERWAFLTDGRYNQSPTDQEGDVQTVNAGDVVQFTALQRHRLIGRVAAYTLVAEIWQHSDSNNLSTEDDIVRLSDDYLR